MRNDEITVLKNVISINENVINHDLQTKSSEDIIFKNVEKLILEIKEKGYYSKKENEYQFFVIFGKFLEGD